MVFPRGKLFLNCQHILLHLYRKIYWTDVGKQPRIEASNLDGSERQIVVNRELGEPNHLVIDYRKQSLCWSDSKLERIECSSLDGSTRRTVLSIEGGIFGLSIFQVGRRTSRFISNEIFCSPENIKYLISDKNLSTTM